MEYAEITKEVFNSLINHSDEPYMVESRELFRKQHYKTECGMQLMILNNYVGDIYQYFIKDVNAWIT